MSCQILQNFIDRHGLRATILKMAEPTPTVAEAARVLEIEERQVIKSLVFHTPEGPVLAVSAGAERLDRKKIAAQLGCSGRKVKFVSAEEAYAITGYVVGSMPPFGHRQTLPTLLDPSVLKYQELYGGGGETDAMLRVELEELRRVTAAIVVDIRECSERVS